MRSWVIAVTFVIGYCTGALAQLFPSRHVELVAPTGAGGGSDLVARTVACTLAELDRVANRVLTPSRVVQEKTGVPSIAEASALLAAGANARLLGARLAEGTVTCAVATGDGR